MITDAQLLYFNSVGLVPGPDESSASFLQRVDECLRLQNTLTNRAQEILSFEPEWPTSRDVFHRPLQHTRRLYDIAPDWIPLFYSNKGLAPWHGGCAWVCQVNENSPTVAFFQLRKPFAIQTRYLGFYQRDELVIHELSHIGRMMFQEPKYEEILAFRSATSRFRRWFGPILLSSNETLLFASVLILLLCIDFALLFQPSLPALQISLGLKIIPLVMIGYGLGRLWSRQRRFAACRRNLLALFRNESVADSVLYRLTDREIDLFSSSSPKEIVSYAQEMGSHSLRWRLLILAYFGRS